jgi:NADPH-dependent 2,4-dienoyl-CoA reductase/sulfur reductase-like enzyme/rhodanese-related sulfurtransferase
MKVLIVGGVAGGASCAARLRRLDAQAEIVMVERGPHVSYANCGLPYHIGGVIEQEASLLVSDVRTFREQFAIDARTNCEAVRIDPKQKIVELRNTLTGEVSSETDDKLVLSPGAAPTRPNLPGIDLPGIFSVRTVPDARAIRQWIGATPGISGMDSYAGFQTVIRKRAVVVGGGFIGLETAENLLHLGLEVTLITRGPQILSPIDPEMSRFVERFITQKGIRVVRNDAPVEFQPGPGGGLDVLTKSGAVFPADIVVLGIGVRPETDLAKTAGIEIGERGGIRVDDAMRTSQSDIFAVGDAVEVRDFITGEWTLVPLAGPANRQGRIAADVIAGRPSRFRGTQGTAILGMFGASVAWTGVSEKTLKRLGDDDYEKIYIFPNSHAGYYPGAKMVAIKFLFRKSNGKVIGAQALGQDGVDKRIDAFAMAIQMGATIYDLEESELTYAPQFGSAKAPVNFAGMVAADVLRGDMPLTHWSAPDPGFLLDVRHTEELAVESIPEALHIPLAQLRDRLAELPNDRTIDVICRSGQRAYYAVRLLEQRGFRARVLSGGMMAQSVIARDSTVPGTLY